jgi:hypothetical protein
LERCDAGRGVLAKYCSIAQFYSQKQILSTFFSSFEKSHIRIFLQNCEAFAQKPLDLIPSILVEDLTSSNSPIKFKR